MKLVPVKLLPVVIFSLTQTFCNSLYASDNRIDSAQQPAQNLSEDDYLAEIPPTLTIARLRQTPANAPTSATIIDRKTIEAAGIIDIAEVFRLVPGFYVATNAGYVVNTNHVVSYHGLSDAYARRMQVLIDGRTVYQPLYGGVQWSELPISIHDIERIEVTRGPNAASYGANAFMGVINIITREATGEKVNIVEMNHGNGRNEAFFHHSGKLNDFNYKLTAGYKEDDGLENRNDFKRTNLLNMRANYLISNQDSLEFQFGYAQGQREEGNLAEDNKLLLPRSKGINNHFELIKWNRQLSKGNSFYVQAYHALDNSDDFMASAALPLPIYPSHLYYNNDVKQQRFDLEAQQNLEVNADLRLAWGANLRSDQLDAPFWTGNNATNHFNLQRLFSELEWSAQDYLTLNTGLMLEHNDFTGTDLSPRASANFKLTPKQTIRIGYSQANRTPSYYEEKFRGAITATTIFPGTNLLYQRIYDTGNLAPEKIDSTEITYIAQLSSFAIDAKVYYDKISDYISSTKNTNFVVPTGYVLAPGGDGKPIYPYTFINQGDVTIQGFETQVNWDISNTSKLLANYAHTVVSSSKVPGKEGEQISNSTPKNITSLLFTQQLKNDWYTSLAAYFTSSVNALSDGTQVKANQRYDARVAKKFNWDKMRGEMSVNIQNLTDRHYHEFAQYNNLRRRAYLNVSLDF